jgi:hypothetical protein
MVGIGLLFTVKPVAGPRGTVRCSVLAASSGIRHALQPGHQVLRAAEPLRTRHQHLVTGPTHRGRFADRPRDQVLWTACGIGSCPASIRPNWPTQPPLPASILLQAFIALWSGAAIDPEGPVVFLSGGVGSFIADRLKLIKKT